MNIATRRDTVPLNNFVKREVDDWVEFYTREYSVGEQYAKIK